MAQAGCGSSVATCGQREAPVARDELETAIESDGAEAASEEGLQGALSHSVATEKPEDDGGLKQIPDRLLTELTAYRTFALRDALAQDPDMALLATLHALCLTLFYDCTSDSCLEIGVKHIVFGSQAPGLNDTAIARAADERHRAKTQSRIGLASRIRRRFGDRRLRNGRGRS
jgi:ParB family chromosome partitioning protein